MLDEARFPTLAAYLASLPAGLDSYPQARSKGTLLRSSLDGHRVEPLLDGLPERLAALISSPPPAGVWVPAVHSDAVFHVVRDHYYPSDEAVRAWTLERTRATVHKPMYRALVRVAGPAVLLRMGAKVHGLLQQGTSVDVVVEGRRVEVTERFPPHLHSREVLLANVALLESLVEITGGASPAAAMLDESPTRARYECTWS
ncbi:MAG: hypothetical protein KF729_22215 [Sandaracinaceae bacterium]|nr:hypothetical protein [Sandaracinaceae bacterium]